MLCVLCKDSWWCVVAEDTFIRPQHTRQLHEAYGAWDGGRSQQPRPSLVKELVECPGEHNTERPA